jgi:hypothetical protein
VDTYLQNYLISFESGSNWTVSIVPEYANRRDLAGGASLSVTVEYPFRFLVLSNLLALIGSNFGNSINLSAETIMRLE